MYEDGFGSRPNESHRMVLKVATQFKDLGIKTILDIGCGRGYLLKELMYQRFLMTGTEIVEEIVSELSKENLSVFPYGIEELKLLDSRHDLVMMVNVLEHLADPQEAIDHAIRLSRKWLIVCVKGESSAHRISTGILGSCKGSIFSHLTAGDDNFYMVEKCV